MRFRFRRDRIFCLQDEMRGPTAEIASKSTTIFVVKMTTDG
jgi:hypothetical protein